MTLSAFRWPREGEAILFLLLHLHGHTKGWPSTCSGCRVDQIDKVARFVCEANTISLCAIGGQQMTVRTSFGPAARVSMSPRLCPEEHARSLGCLYSQPMSMKYQSALIFCALHYNGLALWPQLSSFHASLQHPASRRCFP